MDFRKTVAAALLGALSLHSPAALASDEALAAQGIAYLSVTTFASFTLTTKRIDDRLSGIKDDALAFIGSDGQIRGAQFEQSVRDYRAAYPKSPASDIQLALAVVTSN